MLALFPPPLLWTTTTSLEESISHNHEQQQSYVYKDTEYKLSQPQDHDQHRFPKLASFNGDPAMVVKKLNHNASERDRRTKMNTLYSSLRSVLPAADQTKKLSVPATVSRVLKYIPQLQEQVEGLLQKKAELLSNFSRQGDVNYLEKQSKNAAGKSSSAVSATWLNDREVTLHMTTYKFHNCSVSEILLYLEDNGLLLLNASSFESFEGRVFYNLHVQVEGTNKLDCEFSSEKVMSLIEKRE
ncbi:transcription factor ORG2-like [Corylus avellana]|uniref:transcription factor ORG2-like n=1 Tax=Corylus avellana TaxID=13451 RepID=UPI001E22DB3A|nr:transcription factor ORG2-like [Corylus avellana]